MHLFLGQGGGQAFRFFGVYGANWPQILVKHLFLGFHFGRMAFVVEEFAHICEGQYNAAHSSFSFCKAEEEHSVSDV